MGLQFNLVLGWVPEWKWLLCTGWPIALPDQWELVADWLVGRFPLSSPLELSSGQFLQCSPQRALFCFTADLAPIDALWDWADWISQGTILYISFTKRVLKDPIARSMKTTFFFVVAEPFLTLCQAGLEHWPLYMLQKGYVFFFFFFFLFPSTKAYKI